MPLPAHVISWPSGVPSPVFMDEPLLRNPAAELSPAERVQCLAKVLLDLRDIADSQRQHRRLPDFTFQPTQGTLVAQAANHSCRVTAYLSGQQILALHANKRSLVSDVLAGADQSGKLSSQELVALIRGTTSRSMQRRHRPRPLLLIS